MADLIAGLTLVEGLSRFIPALLVLLLMYGILQFTGALGRKPFIDVLISLCVAIMVLISNKVSSAISFMAPWFVVLFFFLIFVLIAFKAMGVQDSAIMGVLKEYKGISWIIVFIAIIIAAVGLGNVVGQQLLDEQPGYVQNSDGSFTSPNGVVVNQVPEGAVMAQTDFQSNLTTTLFHPQILGFALIGLIAAFTVHFMTKA